MLVTVKSPILINNPSLSKNVPNRRRIIPETIPKIFDLVKAWNKKKTAKTNSQNKKIIVVIDHNYIEVALRYFLFYAYFLNPTKLTAIIKIANTKNNGTNSKSVFGVPVMFPVLIVELIVGITTLTAMMITTIKPTNTDIKPPKPFFPCLFI